MRLYSLAGAELARLQAEMRSFNVSEAGIEHMAPKGIWIVFKVTGLANAAALILKQEFLSKGGEAALNQDAVLGAKHEQQALLFATAAQYRQICLKLQAQPFGLAALAQELLAAINAAEGNITSIPYHARYLKGELDFSRPLIMGIANITPDSFYDGGLYNTKPAAMQHIWAMAEAGADIIDIGGASSRPAYTPLSAEEEQSRLLPLLRELAPQLQTPISVDTDKAEVAEAALAAGAAIINDTSGLSEDMLHLAAQNRLPFVIMHKGGGGFAIVEKVADFFHESLARCEAAGIKRERIILDPGFGFAKDTQENLVLLRHLPDLRLFKRPLLVGLSNKRFIGAAAKAELNEREPANIAAFCWAMAHGAHIIRTHDPKSLSQAARMIKAIMEYGADIAT
ncbi:MAG: dihydropteroate synthase [Firmicutes bacterium]|nr:dihydropteroate synthase [Bacillota bacterium]